MTFVFEKSLWLLWGEWTGKDDATESGRPVNRLRQGWQCIVPGMPGAWAKACFRDSKDVRLGTWLAVAGRMEDTFRGTTVVSALRN